MAYDPSTDQYYQLQAGEKKLPERDGTGYNPNAASPSFFSAWFEMNAANIAPTTTLDVVFVGKMYRGRSMISGIPGKIRMSTLFQNAVIDAQMAGPTNALTTEKMAKDFLGLDEEPEKIVGIYFRPLD